MMIFNVRTMELTNICQNIGRHSYINIDLIDRKFALISLLFLELFFLEH